MAGLSAFRTTVREWIKYGSDVISDALIDSWVKMAEERINHELRHKDQIERARATLVENSTALPTDWLELTFVRFVTVPASNNPNIRAGKPLGYVTEDEYWKRCDSTHPEYNKPCYTIIGNYLFVQPDMAAEGTELEIGYYAEITPLDDDDEEPNYFFVKHPRLYTFATLALSAPYLVEDERVMLWETEATRLINMMNDASKKAKHSGSPLKGRIRSFG